MTFSAFLSYQLVRWRYVLLAVAGVLAIVCYSPARRLGFDRTIVSMFADDDPIMGPYTQLQRVYGDASVALAVYEDPNLFNPDASGINRLIEIRERLEAIDGVIGSISLDMPMGDTIVEPDNGLAERLTKLFEGFTHGEDGRTVSVAILVEPFKKSGIPTSRTIADMRGVMRSLPDGLEPGTVAGEPAMMADAFDYVEQDGHVLFLISTFLLGAIILICFRSLQWVLVPIAVVQFGLLLTRATLYWAQIELTMVSSMLTAIVTVIGVATVIHIIVTFREFRVAGMEPRCALIETFRVLMYPIFWSCVTDAVGFSALMVADVQPVRNFGLMMAMGAIGVIVSAALIIPGLALFGRIRSDPQPAWGEAKLDRQLKRLTGVVMKRPVWLLVAFVVVSAITSYGIVWLETETDFTRNFKQNTPIVQSYELVEDKLGGAGLCDIVLPAPDHMDWKYLSKMLKLEHRLRTEVLVQNEAGETVAGFMKVISLADAIVSASPTNLSKVRRRMRRQIMINAGMRMITNRLPDLLSALYVEDPDNPGTYSYRLMLRARERQPSDQKRAILAQAKAIADEEMGEPTEVTGFFVLLTNLIDSVVRDQWRTFGVALAVIGLSMSIAFGSVRLAVAAVLPNGVPILIVTGMMGWLGLRVNMGAAMIAAVSVGLSVDSSIHFITAFRREILKGKSLHEALNEVQGTVGHAIFFSTIALIFGFAVLCTSQLIPIVYFGVLVSFSMLGGLVGNLIALPLLLRLFYAGKLKEDEQSQKIEPAKAIAPTM